MSTNIYFTKKAKKSKNAISYPLTLTKLKYILNIVKIKSQKNFKKGGEKMTLETLPDWLAALDEEDMGFIRKFVLSSGSLKEMAGLYGVTYPTVRLRLDRLIQKIRLGESAAADPYVTLVKRLAMEDKMDFETAKLLISQYKKATDQKEER